MDETAVRELDELSRAGNKSQSTLFRGAVEELYLKEKRARSNLDFFIECYAKGIVTKDMLLLVLPRKDAESIFIGSATGKEPAESVRTLGA